jgi:hypothetical protein
MYTSILLFALSGFVAHEEAIIVPPSSWQNDYSSAWEKGIRDKKPMAIVIGNGRGGWQNISKDGELDKSVREILEKNYVCVYIDAATDDGKKSAKSLAIESGPALIIGDRSGTNQAFRYQGRLASDQLVSTLKRFSDVADVATVTQDSLQSQKPASQVPQYFYQSAGGCPNCGGGIRR